MRWINSIALLREGVKRVSTLTDRERKAAEHRQVLMDNVFGPCLKYAYNKLAKEKGGMSHSVRRAMFESIQPHLNDLVSEMMKMDLALLPKSEVRKFHRDSLGNCKAGVGQLR